MKRRDIIRQLAEAGFTFEEGGNQTNVLDKNGKVVSQVARHKEIPQITVWKIEAQTGVKLKGK